MTIDIDQAAEPPGPEWTVYRDGGKYTLLASSLRWALELAEPVERRPYTTFGSPDNERAMIRSVVWTPDVAAPPFARERVRLDDAEVLYVVDGLREICVVRESEPNGFRGAAKEFVDAVAWYQHVVRRGVEHRVMSKDGRTPVAVQRFKSGERKGQIKWPSKMPAAERLEFIQAHVSNLELVSTAGESHVLVRAAADRLLALLSPTSTERADEAKLRMWRKKLVKLRELALPLCHYGQPLNDSPHVITDFDLTLGYIDKRLDVFDSVRDHGFAPGSVAWMLPATWDDIQRPRRVKVKKVEVNRDVYYAGVHVPIEHRRAVQIIDTADREPHNPSGEQWAPVERLRTTEPT